MSIPREIVVDKYGRFNLYRISMLVISDMLYVD